MPTININLLSEYFIARGWGVYQVAERFDLHYSYVYRILHGQRNPGGKFVLSLVSHCIEEGLNIADFLIATPEEQNKVTQAKE